MKIILLQDVLKVGKKYEVKEVASGYAMNSLLPKRLAETATVSAVARVKLLQEKEDVERRVREELLAKSLEGLSGVSIEIRGKANEKGHLFSGIHQVEIAAAIKEKTRLDIPSAHIELIKPIKEVGEHSVNVKVGERVVKFTLIVKALG